MSGHIVQAAIVGRGSAPIPAEVRARPVAVTLMLATEVGE